VIGYKDGRFAKNRGSIRPSSNIQELERSLDAARIGLEIAPCAGAAGARFVLIARFAKAEYPV